jgi:5-methylcytosine-specific restriction protein B
MPSHLRLDRIKEAIVRLSDWRGRVKQQTAAHILPMLALLEKGVNKSGWTKFEEADDFTFFDKYCKIPGDPAKPYFDPFSRIFRIASHPHSNIATARKNTFSRRWDAAATKLEGSDTFWQLKDFSKAIVNNVLTKGQDTLRINVVDLATWLFREEAFPDGADSSTLQTEFRQRFPMSDADFNSIFQYEAEARESLYQDNPVDTARITVLVNELAYADAAKASNTPTSSALTLSVVEEGKSQLAEDNSILMEVKALLALGRCARDGQELVRPPDRACSYRRCSRPDFPVAVSSFVRIRGLL